MKRIKCDNIEYRKGYIEVSPNVHEGCINLEAWDIHSEADLKNTDIDNDDFSDELVRANTEIEMSLFEAKELVAQLQKAIDDVQSDQSDT